MKDMNWVVGAKRLYLVVWVVWFVVVGMAALEGATRIKDLLVFIGVGVVVPYTILKVGQWIYAGTQTKQ